MSRRSVVKPSAGQAAAKASHWRAIAVSACEQCGRNRLPVIDPPRRLDEILGAAAPDAARFVFDPDGAGDLPAAPAATGIEFAIGPEGGFEPEELDWFRLAGFRAVRLGPRILRAETAAIAALVWLQTRFGDLRATPAP